jgi:transcriptional regulator with XRE-family HTH domain
MKLKDKLKLIREHLGYTQDHIAERFGLSSDSRRARVSEWESGKGEPGRVILLKYAELAKLDVKRLIDDRENIDI